jgi:hypothetical protein
MSRNHRPNYVVAHYTFKPKSEFTETYKTAKEAIEAVKQFSYPDYAGYSEVTCTLTGKKGVRPWNKKKIRWTRILVPAPAPKESEPAIAGELQLALPLVPAPASIGLMLPVASQAAEHGLPQEIEQ